MQDLAVNEEIAWLRPRFLNIQPKEQRRYDKYMQERKTFWGDRSNLSRYLEKLHPTSTLQIGLAYAPNSNATAPTASKRSADFAEDSTAKRVRPIEDAVTEPPTPPVQNNRRRGHDNGTSTDF